MITHKKALKLLKEHFLTPSKITCYYIGHNNLVTSEPVRGTSFYATFGYKDSYKLKDIFNWLGY